MRYVYAFSCFNSSDGHIVSKNCLQAVRRCQYEGAWGYRTVRENMQKEDWQYCTKSLLCNFALRIFCMNIVLGVDIEQISFG